MLDNNDFFVNSKINFNICEQNFVFVLNFNRNIKYRILSFLNCTDIMKLKCVSKNLFYSIKKDTAIAQNIIINSAKYYKNKI